MAEVFAVDEAWAKSAHMDAEGYRRAYASAIEEPEVFWGEQAQRLQWMKPFTRAKDVNFDLADFRIRWFEDGLLNASANCLDRHLADRASRSDLVVGRRTRPRRGTLTYRELHAEVCRMSNVPQGVWGSAGRPGDDLPAR
jgi:acetyl-CoA synthetase